MMFLAAMIDDEKDQTRFYELYEGYRKQMYLVAFRVLKDHGLAEDAVHNAFFGIAVSMKTVPEGEGKELRAYLFTCAKNAALRILQKERRQGAAQEKVMEIFSNAPSAYEEVEQSLAYDRLVGAIRKLDAIYRDVLLMHYVYDLSLDEISITLGRKKKTVKQQLTRGKKQLLALYRKEEGTNEAVIDL